MEKGAPKQASKSRQRLLNLSKTITNLASKIISTRFITKGTIYNQKKKCGNKNCKCSRGELHTTRVLSFSHYGKTILKPLTKYSIIELSKIEKQVQNYQRYRRSRAEIVHYFKLLIAEINKLEKNLLIEIAPKKAGGKIEQGKRNNRWAGEQI